VTALKIFLRGLPHETSSAALREFAEAILKRKWYQLFGPRIKIKDCVVLMVKDLETQTIEFHGLIEVRPYASGVKAVKRLNGKRFLKKPIKARKWYERVAANDRRAFFEITEVGPAEDRRNKERRRQVVVEIYKPAQFRGMRQFHREGGG